MKLKKAINRTSLASIFYILLVLTAGVFLLNQCIVWMLEPVISDRQLLEIKSNDIHQRETFSFTGRTEDSHVGTKKSVSHRNSDQSQLKVSNKSVDVSHLKTKSRVSARMLDQIKLKVSNKSVDVSSKRKKRKIQNIRSLCPENPPGLVGPVKVNKNVSHLDVLEKRYFSTRPGGHFKPAHCESRTKVAILVPYRNRTNHLLVLLNNLIPFLIKQQAEFAIFIIEPIERLMFNRALLINVGFLESLKTDNFTCFVLHDVDLIPENDFNLYRCDENPRHMAAANSKFEYKVRYPRYAGGVTAVSRATFQDINGMSNLYFGWGGEDDDFLYRLFYKKYKLLRYPMDIGRYLALDHGKDIGNPENRQRFTLLWLKNMTMGTMGSDGLSSLKYKVVDLKRKPLFTWILIDFDINFYNNTAQAILTKYYKSKEKYEAEHKKVSQQPSVGGKGKKQ